jgi:hypothetical protein
MNYRLVFRKLTEENWKHENRPHLNFTMRNRLFGIAFNDRVRLEYNSLEDLTDFGTIRNRIAINPPFELEPDKERLILRDYTVKPYGSYEFSFDTLDDSITRQRFQAGLSVAFTERGIGDLFYTRQDSRSTIDDTDLNITGVNLTLLFQAVLCRLLRRLLCRARLRPTCTPRPRTTLPRSSRPARSVRTTTAMAS